MALEDRDLWLADFVLEQLEEGSAPSKTRTLLAALQKIGVEKFRMPWRVLEGWCSFLPPPQAPALPEAVLRAYAGALVAMKEYAVATTLVLCYFGVLRISEALRLSPADVYIMDGGITLYLARTKRGFEETVVIEDTFVHRWLRWYVATGVCYQRDNVLLPCSYARVQRKLELCGEHFGLTAVRFTTHSCRRGGATRLLIRRWSVEAIALFGRWKNVRSCHDYLRRGQVFLMRVADLTKGAQWELIDIFAKGVWRIWRLSAQQPSS